MTQFGYEVPQFGDDFGYGQKSLQLAKQFLTPEELEIRWVFVKLSELVPALQELAEKAREKPQYVLQEKYKVDGRQVSAHVLLHKAKNLQERLLHGPASKFKQSKELVNFLQLTQDVLQP